MRRPAGWNRLAPDQKQALTTIADKIARMLNGDPNYIDNVHDIIGYARLVEKRMEADAVEAANVGTCYYVSHTAVGNGTGSSWADACITLSAATEKAGPEDTVHVAEGHVDSLPVKPGRKARSK